LKNNDFPSISAFPQDGKSWRIDWFGDLAFPNRSIRRTQPSLLLHLSKVLDASFLPLLRIGDIWRDGKLEASPGMH
jgi:hypothetical protein